MTWFGIPLKKEDQLAREDHTKCISEHMVSLGKNRLSELHRKPFFPGTITHQVLVTGH